MKIKEFFFCYSRFYRQFDNISRTVVLFFGISKIECYYYIVDIYCVCIGRLWIVVWEPLEDVDSAWEKQTFLRGRGVNICRLRGEPPSKSSLDVAWRRWQEVGTPAHDSPFPPWQPDLGRAKIHKSWTSISGEISSPV